MLELKLTHILLDRFAVFNVYVDVLSLDFCGKLPREE